METEICTSLKEKKQRKKKKKRNRVMYSNAKRSN
jgi:hypothetical protein